MESTIAVILLFVCVALVQKASAKFGIASRSGLTSDTYDLHLDEPVVLPEITNCHDGCLQKFSLDATTCTEAPVCSECWETCKFITPPIGQSDWNLRIASMIKQEFLVATHLAWERSTVKDCLVTWEVFGGGLMGTLLTDTSNVELSLWPDTKYRVAVTCKNKLFGYTERSRVLTVDTSQAVKNKPDSTVEDFGEFPDTYTSTVIVSTTESIDDTDNDSDNEIEEGNTEDFAESYRRRLVSASDAEYRYKSLVLGMCAALIVFLFILTVLCASHRSRSDTKLDQNAQQSNVLLSEVITIQTGCSS